MKNKKAKKSESKLDDLTSMKSAFDPSGSYTGVDLDNPHATPVQDADDL